MYEYLNGTLTDCSPQKAVIDVRGVGYQVLISIATFEKLPKIGAEVRLFTSLVVREDSQKLFGFLNPEEREFFQTLCDISGIGPRLAVAILGHLPIDDLCIAIEEHDTKAIVRIPGIGKKMAERLILELRDKLAKGIKEKISLTSPKAQGAVGDAISALIHLGYNPLDAQKAVKGVLKGEKEPPLSELISLALKAKLK